MIIYEEKLKNKGIKTIPLEAYKGSDIKILHKCPCGFEWSVIPSSVLRGSGVCNTCANKIRIKTSTKTQSEYLEELKQLNIMTYPMENYITIKKKINHKCSCGIIWKISPAGVLKGNKCPSCTSKLLSIKKRKTHSEYLIELKQKNILVEPLKDYQGVFTKIFHKCVCGEKWAVTPQGVLRGNRCPTCKENKIDLYKDRKTILYYVKIDSIYKIGITILDGRRTVENNILKKRFAQDIKNGRDIKILFSKVYNDGSLAYMNEQKIIMENIKYKYKGKKMIKSGNTELFSENILERITL